MNVLRSKIYVVLHSKDKSTVCYTAGKRYNACSFSPEGSSSHCGLQSYRFAQNSILNSTCFTLIPYTVDKQIDGDTYVLGPANACDDSSVITTTGCMLMRLDVAPSKLLMQCLHAGWINVPSTLEICEHQKLQSY